MDIHRIEFRPPLAIGRLGGASTPMDNYVWREDPTIHGTSTVIDPALSFDVLDDGSLLPFIPTAIRFRDGGRLRPVAPFFELWARVTDDDGAECPQPVPLTNALLKQAGGKLTGLVYDVAVANRKAARRSGSDADAFAAVIQARGNDHTRQRLLASSPSVPGGNPLVLPSNPVPLGWFRVIRPTQQHLNGVDLDVLRVRFTPAEGHVYGPPTAVAATDPVTERTYEIVPAANRILNPDATWLKYRLNDNETAGYFHPDPPDTYDGAGQHPGARDVFDGADRGHEQSWGVVDDTCDGVITAHLVINGEHLSATARICVGPPDYAPDRRPFLSLADDLADRDREPTTAQAMRADPDGAVPGMQRRLADLFERVWETTSLTNLDAIRARALIDNANAPAANGVPVSDLPAVNQDSMRPQDKNWAGRIPRPSQDRPSDGLIFTRLIDDEHGPLADEFDLMDFFSQQAGRQRVRLMVRPAYGNFDQLQVSVSADAQPDPDYRDPRINRDRLHDMRMPPYMRDELAGPLSLTHRQYAELIAYIDYLDLAAKVALQILNKSITIESGDSGFAASVTMELQRRGMFTEPSSELITPPLESITPPVTTPLRRRIDARLRMISGDGQ